jgi:hypothetical protein
VIVTRFEWQETGEAHIGALVVVMTGRGGQVGVVASEGGEAAVEIRDCKVSVPIVRQAQHLGVRRLEVQRARVCA